MFALRAFNVETALIEDHAKSEMLVMMRCQVKGWPAPASPACAAASVPGARDAAEGCLAALPAHCTAHVNAGGHSRLGLIFLWGAVVEGRGELLLQAQPPRPARGSCPGRGKCLYRCRGQPYRFPDLHCSAELCTDLLSSTAARVVHDARSGRPCLVAQALLQAQPCAAL